MKFKNLLIINAILFLPFGIGFVLITAPLISLYGADPEAGMVLTAQLYGGLLIGIGLLCWLSRDVADVAAQRAMQLSFMIAYTINAIIHARGTVTGMLNALGWSAVILYLLLTAGYAYFYFTTPRGQEG